ncbi:MAG: hypothetical protein WD069_11625 [Planctomycetales bacterium]
MDLIKELRLRRWARTHYVSAARRRPEWHAVVLDEMRLKEAELDAAPVAEFSVGEQPPAAIPPHGIVEPSGGGPERTTESPCGVDCRLPVSAERLGPITLGCGYVPLMPDHCRLDPPHGRLADPKLLKRIEQLEELHGADAARER